MGGEMVPMSCIGNDETAIVVGVTYEGCMKYKIENYQVTVIWVKPGLGEVKTVITNSDGSYYERSLISTNVR